MCIIHNLNKNFAFVVLCMLLGYMPHCLHTYIMHSSDVFVIHLLVEGLCKPVMVYVI